MNWPTSVTDKLPPAGNRSVFTIGAIAIGLVVLAILGSPFAIIEGGERGVVVTLGKIRAEALQEGLNIVTPFISTVKRLSIRVQKSEVEASAASKDLQTVGIKAVVNWQIDPEKVVTIYRKFGAIDQVMARLIEPENQSAIKTVASQRTAEQLLTQRQLFEQDALEILRERLAAEGVTVTNVSIANMNFSQEFDRAIEQKQIAQQEAQKAFYLVEKAKNEAQALREKAKGEADAEVERARGSAESQQLMSKTITPEILKRQWIDKWDGALPETMAGNADLLLQMKP